MGFFVLLASLLSAGGAASFVGNGDSGGSSETARGEQDQLNENDAAQDTGNGDLLVDPDFGSADDSAEPSAPRTAEASQGDDTLAGTNLADTIFGLGGDDVIDGRGGADSIDGGDGDDVIDAGSGADTIDGGAGDDTLRGNAGDVLLRGQAGDDLLLGEGGDTTLLGGAGNDILRGMSGDDSLEGDDGDDVLFGDGGKNIVDGGDGNDILLGSDAGQDTLSGGAGNDTLLMAQSDVLFGEGGADNFITGEWSAVDDARIPVIEDYDASEDVITVLFGPGAEGEVDIAEDPERPGDALILFKEAVIGRVVDALPGLRSEDLVLVESDIVQDSGDLLPKSPGNALIFG